MTTNLDVDLRELFVMPRVLARPLRKKTADAESADEAALMDLAAARQLFAGGDENDERAEPRTKRRLSALDQVKRNARNVIVGAPGGGKSPGQRPNGRRRRDGNGGNANEHRG